MIVQTLNINCLFRIDCKNSKYKSSCCGLGSCIQYLSVDRILPQHELALSGNIPTLLQSGLTLPVTGKIQRDQISAQNFYKWGVHDQGTLLVSRYCHHVTQHVQRTCVGFVFLLRRMTHAQGVLPDLSRV
jgi:hypothetical protein